MAYFLKEKSGPSVLDPGPGYVGDKHFNPFLHLRKPDNLLPLRNLIVF